MNSSSKTFDPTKRVGAIKLTTKPGPLIGSHDPRKKLPEVNRLRLMKQGPAPPPIINISKAKPKAKPKAVSAPVAAHKKQLANAFKKESPNLPAHTVAFAKIRPAFYN